LRKKLSMKLVITISIAAVIVAALVGGIFAGCGGGTSEALPKRSLPADASPETILVEALRNTNDTRTFHYNLAWATTILPTRQQTDKALIDMKVVADQDMQNSSAQGTQSIANVTLNFVIVDNTEYRKEQFSESWIAVPQQTALLDFGSVVKNATEYLKNFQSIEQVGDETIDGRPCIHLKLQADVMSMLNRPDLRQFLATGPAGANNEVTIDIDKYRASLSDLQLSIEYWVDKDYLVLRKSYQRWQERMKPGTSPEVGSDRDITLTMLMSAYNQPLNIQAPSPVVGSSQ